MYQRTRLKLYRSFSFLNLQSNFPDRESFFLTIEQLEKLQNFKKVSDKLAVVDDNAMPFCINKVAENVIHTTGVVLLLCHQAFANVKDDKICETLDIVTLFFRQLVVFYSRKKTENTGGTTKKLMKNDYTCCVCSSILYTIGSYCVPRYSKFMNKKKKFANLRHTGGKALTSKNGPATDAQKYTMPTYSNKQEATRSMDIMSVANGSEEVRKVSARQPPPDQNRAHPKFFYTRLVEFVGMRRENDFEVLLNGLNNYFELRDRETGGNYNIVLRGLANENSFAEQILSLGRVRGFTTVLIRLQKVIEVYVDNTDELFYKNKVVPIPTIYFESEENKAKVAPLFPSKEVDDINTIFFEV